MTLFIILIIAGLLFAGFAAAAETSLTSVSRIRMRTLADEGNRAAKVVTRLHDERLALNGRIGARLDAHACAYGAPDSSPVRLLARIAIGAVPSASGTAVGDGRQ